MVRRFTAVPFDLPQRIVALNPDESIIKAKEVFDGQGLYAIPGLIDCHFHFESQLVNPVALAEAMVPAAQLRLFAECLDILSSTGQRRHPGDKRRIVP